MNHDQELKKKRRGKKKKKTPEKGEKKIQP